MQTDSVRAGIMKFKITAHLTKVTNIYHHGAVEEPTKKIGCIR